MEVKNNAVRNTSTRTRSDTRKRPWRRENRVNTQLSKSENPNILFSLTLAALTNPRNPSSESLIKKCSNKFLQTLLRKSPYSDSLNSEYLFSPILALIPLLLKSKCEEIACTGARIVGALALVSIEVNEKIALDTEIVRVLVVKTMSSEKRVVKKAVCNAVLDLSTTSFGRQRVLELSGLDYLMLAFLQVQKSSTCSISIIVIEKEGHPCLGVELGEDELPLLLLEAALTLTNFCDNEQLKRIPRMLVEAFLTYLKEVWRKVLEQLLAPKLMNFSNERCCFLGNLTSHKLAEGIFRLSLEAPSISCPTSSEIITRHVFGPRESSIKNFISEHWESSPFIIRKPPNNSDVVHDIFSSFMDSLTCEGKVARFLSFTLRGMVSCPPVALNEIDIPSFLNDVRDTLGCPLIYQQDVRIVRTNPHSKSEEHYFQDFFKSISIDDIVKCQEAYSEGYTIALRGLEFRFKSIAAISREIASLFGQPSVGANLYVTPPNSQGLACHCDDHCVFVCQLRGTKQWTVFPRPVVQLPRLFEHLEVPQDLMVDSKQILLKEGDVLYIPRGFAHEARTVTGVSTSEDDSEFSVHLTLAIEVEPPFEWEGFAHVGLHQWSRKMEFDNFAPGSSGLLQAIMVNILHVAIRLISDNEPLFRKACLVAASSWHPETIDFLDNNQRAIFNQLMNKIHELASFGDALEFVQIAVDRNEDPFHWLRWLDHLNGEKLYDRDIWHFTPDGIRKSLHSIYQNKDIAKATFDHVKSKCCSEVLFDDAKESFKIVHSMYKEARMKYTNGMLSLHH